MKTKEIKIAGKDVTLAYCFGTEIGYKMLTDEEIQNLENLNRIDIYFVSELSKKDTSNFFDASLHIPSCISTL